MSKRKNVSIVIPECNVKKVFSVPEEWDDRTTVSKLVQAFDLFGDTDEGAQTIINAHFHSGKKQNSNLTIFGWDVLLEHTPREFLEKQEVHPLDSVTDDTHVITLLEEEEELPMDDYREQVVKTIDNYKIVRMYVEGEKDEEGQDFYNKWSFLYQTMDEDEDESEGHIAYDIYPIDEEEGIVIPDFQRRFYSLEEVETFIKSVSFVRTSEHTFELNTSKRNFAGNEKNKSVVATAMDGEVDEMNFNMFNLLLDKTHRNLIRWD